MGRLELLQDGVLPFRVTICDPTICLTGYRFRSALTGKLIHTLGHTSGSLGLLLETGEAFAGDSGVNGLPLFWSPGLPVFAEDMVIGSR